jgi:hypothetical protein
VAPLVAALGKGGVDRTMAQRRIQEIAADALWREWRRDFETIKQDTHFLFRERRTFRDVVEVFRKNTRLQTCGGHLWDWIRASWVSHVAMRIRRETDEQSNTVNFNQLLREIEARCDVATRGRYFAMLNLDANNEWLRPMLEETFTRVWLPVDSPASTNPADRVDGARVAADRESLQRAAARVIDVANQHVAHRTRVDVRSLTVPEVDAAFDAIEETLKKYHLLLNGASLMDAEPTPQYDTHEVFTFPWLEPQDPY